MHVHMAMVTQRTAMEIKTESPDKIRDIQYDIISSLRGRVLGPA